MSERLQSQENSGADAILAIVGITADRAKRRQLRRYLEANASLPIFMPVIPYFLGLHFSCRWLEWYLQGRVRTRQCRRPHVLAFIGGGFLLRLAASRWSFIRFRRVLYDRSPIQEAVPRILLCQVPRLILRLSFSASVIDLASEDLSKLPFPKAELEQGLLIESEASSLARRLGLRREALPTSAWRPETLLTGASAMKQLPVSHDDVYTSEAFLSEALGLPRDRAFPSNGQCTRCSSCMRRALRH